MEDVFSDQEYRQDDSNWIYSPQGTRVSLGQLRKTFRDSFEEFRGIPVGRHKNVKDALVERLEVWSDQYEAINAAWEKNPSDRLLRCRAGEAWARKQYLFERLYALRTVTHHAVEVGIVPSYDEWNASAYFLQTVNGSAMKPDHSPLFDTSADDLRLKWDDDRQRIKLISERRFEFGTTWREQFNGIVKECERFGLDPPYKNHDSMRTGLHHFAKRNSI